jgi:hypothetical protein
METKILFHDRPVTWLKSFRDVFLLHAPYFINYCSVGQLSKHTPLNTLCILVLSEDHFVFSVFSEERLLVLMR